MYIWSQDRTIVSCLNVGSFGIREFEGKIFVIQSREQGHADFFGSYANRDSAKSALLKLYHAMERGDSMFVFPDDVMTEEVLRIYAGSGFLDVTRQGRVVNVSVNDSMGHGCICNGKPCKGLGGCLATLAETSERSRDGDN